MAIKTKIKCPYCDKEMGKQGIYGHLAGNHPEKEAEYRAANPPKRSALPKNTPDYDYSEEEKGSENYKEPEETAPAPETIEVKPEVIEPKKEVAPKEEKKDSGISSSDGDTKASKPKSFLSRVLDYNIEF